MKQLDRIRSMEEKMDRVSAAVQSLQDALEQLDSVRDAAGELAEYYGSGRWRQDYEDDEAGKLPADLKRGVLSQDGLYDLLTEYERLRNLLEESR